MKVKVRSTSCHPDLVVASLRDVTHPRQSRVATFLNDFEVPHLDTRDCEVRDFELDLDGSAGVLLSLIAFDRRKTELSSHQEFFASWELLYAPDHGVLIGHILDSADVALEHWRVNIRGNRNKYFYVVCNALALELSFSLDQVFNFTS